MDEGATAEDFKPNGIMTSRKPDILNKVRKFTDPRLGDYPKHVYGDAIEFALLVEPADFRQYRAEKHDWDIEHQ